LFEINISSGKIATVPKLIYSESEQEYKLYLAVPLGITHSKHLCNSKSAKNEYK